MYDTLIFLLHFTCYLICQLTRKTVQHPCIKILIHIYIFFYSGAHLQITDHQPNIFLFASFHHFVVDITVQVVAKLSSYRSSLLGFWPIERTADNNSQSILDSFNAQCLSPQHPFIEAPRWMLSRPRLRLVSIEFLLKSQDIVNRSAEIIIRIWQ